MFILYAILILHIILFFVSTIFIWVSVGDSRNQRLLQTAFVLIIPLVGPVIYFSIYIMDRSKTNKPSDRYMGKSIDDSPYSGLD